MGISYMNLGYYEEVLRCFQKFPDSPESLKYTAAFYRAMEEFENESSTLRRLVKII